MFPFAWVERILQSPTQTHSEAPRPSLLLRRLGDLLTAEGHESPEWSKCWGKWWLCIRHSPPRALVGRGMLWCQKPSTEMERAWPVSSCKRFNKVVSTLIRVIHNLLQSWVIALLQSFQALREFIACQRYAVPAMRAAVKSSEKALRIFMQPSLRKCHPTFMRFRICVCICSGHAFFIGNEVYMKRLEIGCHGMRSHSCNLSLPFQK